MSSAAGFAVVLDIRRGGRMARLYVLLLSKTVQWRIALLGCRNLWNEQGALAKVAVAVVPAVAVGQVVVVVAAVVAALSFDDRTVRKAVAAFLQRVHLPALLRTARADRCCSH